MESLKEGDSMPRRHELTDAQWETIRELLPDIEGDPCRTAVDNWLFVNAVLFVLKTGIPKEDLPGRYGEAQHGLEAVRPLVCVRHVGMDRQGPGGSQPRRGSVRLDHDQGPPHRLDRATAAAGKKRTPTPGAASDGAGGD
jgi:putative transposase